VGLYLKCRPDGADGGWKNADDEMRTGKCG